MKKYILSIFATLPIIIGMTNATNYNITCDNYECIPSYINIEGTELNNITCNKNGNEQNNLMLFNEQADTNIVIICNDEGNAFIETPEEQVTELTIPSGTYDITTPDEGRFNFAFSVTGTPTGGETGGENGEDTGGGIVAGGINAFSGIIERLGSIFGEFGPYIIYIALACIGISLLFKALKSLLGFTDNKAKNSIGGRAGMKERRRRRRRNRRFQRAIYTKERRKGGETYGQYYNKKRGKIYGKQRF